MIISRYYTKPDVNPVHIRRIYRAMRCAGTPAWMARSYVISMLRATSAVVDL